MGRTLKRVPLDFDWPLNKVWHGYINPFQSRPCEPCGGSGFNPETRAIEEAFYRGERWCSNITQDEVGALIAKGRLMDYTHRWDGEWIPIEPPPHVPAEAVNEAERSGHIHDAINRWILVETRATRLGVYGQCKWCKGEGELWASEEAKRLSEEWKEAEPPKGDGFQLWETTSEGSPMSPVFGTLDELCEWLEGHAATFGTYEHGHRATTAQWKEMLEKGFVYARSGNAVFI